MSKEPTNSGGQKFNVRSVFLWALIIFPILWLYYSTAPGPNEISFSQLWTEIQKRPNDFSPLVIQEGESTIIISGKLKTENLDPKTSRPREESFLTIIPRPAYQEFEKFLRHQQIAYSIRAASDFSWIFNFLYLGLPIVVFLLIFRMMRGGRLSGSKGGLSFLRSHARRQVPEGMDRKTFADVAGIDEAKEELQEIIAFLKDPALFSRLGGKMPKGFLLIGPPGTGKTLLARAVAGEADVPFFSVGGSGFIELFVGVGASRVRDTFEQARSCAPCIIFIDELDAIGQRRGARFVGGHAEQEQTLDQLLAEMDGFEPNKGVVVIGATNRPNILDPALLRPGRFDRQILVPMPDLEGRLAILQVHIKDVDLAKGLDIREIARGTIGFSGADLANLVNEAALKAARNSKKNVGMEDLEWAREKVLAGPERKSKRMNEEERRIVAFHEAGHAVVSRALTNADPLHKVSIVPRGFAAGLTWHLPKEDRQLETKSRLEAQLAVLMGGRLAEEIGLGPETISTGAENDFDRATILAHNMVCHWCMGETGPRTFGQRSRLDFINQDIIEERRNYSGDTANKIDREIDRILAAQKEQARKILTGNKEVLEAMAKRLLEVETMNSGELDKFFDEHEIKNTE